MKTGPGVTWPTAIASSSCVSVSQCHRSTRSARIKASNTYPLPYSMAPTFRKNRNKGHNPNEAAPALPAWKSTANAGGVISDLRSLLRRTIVSAKTAANPAPKSTSSSCILRNVSITATMPTTARNFDLIAVRASDHNACSTIAMITGLTP